jgi:hypothetical protein
MPFRESAIASDIPAMPPPTIRTRWTLVIPRRQPPG